MEQRPPRPMTPFDELTMPPQFRMLKLMLPFTPDAIRPMLAIFLKFMELQYTIRLVSQTPNCFFPDKSPLHAPSSQGFSFEQMEEILPYLSPQEKEMVESMRNMMNMMEMMQTMLSPDQQELFRTYQNMFEMEGEDSHE